MVPRVRVDVLWDVINSLGLDLLDRTEILGALMVRKGGIFGLMFPREVAEGVFRASFYDPEYHFPLLVLEYFYRVVEPVGRRKVRILGEHSDLE